MATFIQGFSGTCADHATLLANTWSSSRYNDNNAWIFNGNRGYTNNNNFYNSNYAWPCVNLFQVTMYEYDQLISDLIDSYFLTLKNKARSRDTVLFSLHWQRNIARLIEQLRTHTYEPSAYTFMKKTPAPREIVACELSLRLCDTHVDQRLRPGMEAEMTDRAFNNRVGLGNVEAINTVISDIYEVSKGFTNDNCWIIKLDMSGYFPNANQDFAYDQLRKVLLKHYHGEDKDLIEQMLLRCVYSYPADHCRRISPLTDWEDYPPYKSIFTKPDGVGGAIGRLIWQIAMNFYLNDFDHFMVDECGFHYSRFVDDMVIITDNKEMFLQFIPVIRERLAAAGCQLHTKKFYCQHYTKGVEFLGAYIKKDRVYVSRRIVRNFAQKIRYFNRRAGVKSLTSFIASMNSYLGILKGRNTHRLTLRMIDQISPKWWKYCHFNPERVCIQPNAGYTEKEILYRRYHVKLKSKYQKHGNKRANRKT